jgi:stearoyl-CoA desaturase (delta-9 desaturase)
MSGQGSSVIWTAIHRGYHHAHADQPKDLHSPIHGYWQAFAGWSSDLSEANSPIRVKYAIDLLRKPNHLWFHQHNWKILWSVPVTVALYDWKAAMAMTLAIGGSLCSENLINIFGHIQWPGAYRNFDTPDKSVNHWIGYVTWGHGWHNNHHAHPNRFSFKQRWWEFDPVCIFRPFLGPSKVDER